MSTGSFDVNALFNAIPGCYLVLSPELKILGASDGYLKATMTAREAITGKDLFDVFPEDPNDPAAPGAGSLKASFSRVMALKKPDTMAVLRYPIRRPESEGGGFEERFWSPSNHPVLGPDGSVRAILNQVTDVTALVRAGEALKAMGSGHDIYSIFDHLFEGVQVLDFESRYLYLNETGLRHGHSTREALYGKRMVDCYPGIEASEVFSTLQRCLGERVQQRMVNKFSYPDGRTAHFELYFSPVPAGALILSYDISAKAELEQRLRQSERLESIGRLAGGIAHDFNNLLTVMVGYADLLRTELPAGGSHQEALAQILAAGSRASELTRQLLAFGRRQVLKTQVVDLNAVVSEVAGMLSRVIGATVMMDIKPCHGACLVVADGGQLQQVIMNLALNARDAMAAGGRLKIMTEVVALAEGAADLEPGAKPGDYAVLSVRDSGHGIDPETRAHIFEPFFTTKGPAKGTGLGLATVHGIVTQSGGWILVESEQGQGSCFKVYWPAAQASGKEGRPEEQGPIPPSPGRRILLVDDEPDVLRLFEHVLSLAGFIVTTANSGANAITALQGMLAAGQAPALLVTDLSLPDRHGRKVADEVRQLCPGIRILFTSGYNSLQQGAGNMTLQPGEAFLGKPISPSKLVRQVQKEVGGD